MSRRSGRQTKVPEHFEPVLANRTSTAQKSKKNKRQKRDLLTPANALQPNSPILHEDIQSLFSSTILSWATLSEHQKRILIDVFPPTYRNYDIDEAGKLKCPITAEFAAGDHIIKRDVARFKRDLEAGFYMKKWQDEGRKAMKERAEGLFDEYRMQHTEDHFGEVPDDQKDQTVVDARIKDEMDDEDKAKDSF
jgi:Asx homology domain